MRTRLLKASVIVALLGILLGMPLLLTAHRIRPEMVPLIKEGMSESQVEELLGAKPGDYDGYQTTAGFAGESLPKVWTSRSCSIIVLFDESWHVILAHRGYSEPSTWWARLFDRLAQRFLPRDAEPETLSSDW